jgi:hypothetical protein
MRKGTAVGLALAVGAAGFAEFQGNFEASAEGTIPGYWLDPGSFVGSWVEEKRLEAEAVPDSTAPIEGSISPENLEALAEQLQTGVSPRCPEETQYQFSLAERPNTQLCLNTAETDARTDEGQIIFPIEVNPDSRLLVDVEATLDGNPDACSEAVSRLTRYGQSIIAQMELSDDVGVLIKTGDCGTYQPEPRPPRPAGRMPE